MASPLPQVRVGVGVFVLQSGQESRTNPRFLMGRRIGSVGAGTWALPGGHLEFGETPEECAAREVLEETGLHISVNSLRFLTATNSIMEEEGKHYVTLFMVGVRDGHMVEEEEPRVMEKDKCEGWEWVSWEEMVKWMERERAVAEQKGTERKLFLPLVNLVRQRPGLIPSVD